MRRADRKPELLAPAGDMERLKMAVAYGADAVYLAGTTFGMRAFAGNFDERQTMSVEAGAAFPCGTSSRSQAASSSDRAAHHNRPVPPWRQKRAEGRYSGWSKAPGPAKAPVQRQERWEDPSPGGRAAQRAEGCPSPLPARRSSGRRSAGQSRSSPE